MTPTQAVDAVAAELELELGPSVPLSEDAADLRGWLESFVTGLRRDVLGATAADARRLGALRCEEGVDLEVLVKQLTRLRDRVAAGVETGLRAAMEPASVDSALLLAGRRLDQVHEHLVMGLARGYLDAVEDRARRWSAAMRTMVGLARAVNRSLDIDGVAAHALRAVVDAAGCEAAALWLRPEPGHVPVLRHSVGLSPEEELELERVAGWSGLGARAVPGLTRLRTHERGDRFADGAAAALVVDGEPAGLLVVLCEQPRPADDTRLGLVGGAAEDLALAVGRSETHRLEARTDHLTGLGNRAAFEQALTAALAAAERHHRPLTVLLADLDHLKQINDLHGHAAGDDAIRMAATVIRTAVRASDTCARLGGDEFAVAMPDTTVRQARDVVARLRAALEAANAGARPGIRLSVGLAGWEPGSDWPRLYRLADARLYRDKARHREQELRADD